MSVLAGLLIVGIPLIMSLLWFFYWVIKLKNARKRLLSNKKADGSPKDSPLT
jgi:hypothetical protein